MSLIRLYKFGITKTRLSSTDTKRISRSRNIVCLQKN